MAFSSQSSEPEEKPYVLPRYLRYARALALLSGAVVGVAAGAAAVSSTGCTCSGTPCPGQSYQPPLTRDAASDLESDARMDATQEAKDGAVDSGGGGPRPAPRLPRGWIA